MGKGQNKILNLSKFQSLMKTLLNKYTFFTVVCCLLFSSNLVAQNEGVVHIQSSEKIKLLIAKKRAYNKNIKKVKGYKIQLFYGSEQAAYRVRDKFSSVFPDTSIQIKFFSPEWKVWVGSYKTKLEVDRVLKDIKETFPSAIPIPAMIEI